MEMKENNELLNLLYEGLHLERLNQELREDIMSYLKGEKKQFTLPKMKHKITYYITYRLPEYLNTKADDLAKRGYYVTSLLNTPEFISAHEYNNERYELYHEIGIDKDIVIQDVSSTIARLLRTTPCNILSFLRTEVRNFNEEEKSLLSSLMKYYGEEVKAYFKAQEGEEGKEAEVLLGHALSIVVGSQKPEQRERAITRLEEDLVGVLHKLYSEKELETACEIYCQSNLVAGKSKAGKVRGLFSKIIRGESGLIEGQAKALKKLTLAIGMTFYQESQKLNDLLRLQMGLVGGYYSEQMFMNFSIEKASQIFSELIETLKMPTAFRISYYSEKMLSMPFSKTGEWYEGKLRSLYEEDKPTFKATFEFLKQTKQTGALTLLGLLRKYGEPISQADIADLKVILIHMANQELTKWQKNKNYQVYQGPLLFMKCLRRREKFSGMC